MIKDSNPSVYSRLKVFNGDQGAINVIIETPKGSSNKFDYDVELGLFKLAAVLPAGIVFPFDFGYIPDTLGDDGDPLDVLVLMDQPTFTGCLVSARLIGIIEATQTEDGEKTRNDRLIAVAEESNLHKDVQSLKDLSPALIDEIEKFFVSYHRIRGKKFKVLQEYGPRRARKALSKGIEERFQQERKEIRKRAA